MLGQLRAAQRLSRPCGLNQCRIRPSAPIRSGAVGIGIRSNCRSRRSGIMARSAQDVIVLDFDGVLLDSEGEITQSALVAARQRWPHLFEGVSEDVVKTVERKMRDVRPVLVRGYEAMIMLRMLMEDLDHVDLILASWERVLPAKTAEYGEDVAELTAWFEGVRNQWMNERTDSWMALQQPYPGTVDALKSCPYPVYLATSKAGHRVSALMGAVLGVEMAADSPRMFAALLPPEEAKAQALRTISSQHPGATLHFVDDRLDTHKAILAHPELSHCRLYLASWGYSTAPEREEGRGMKGVRVINLKQFGELMRFGLVMEVDDGCEPTAEEVAAGVYSDE